MSSPSVSPKIDVSIVMPVLNGEKWIEDCFHSIINQSFSGTMEVSIFNDGSTDSTSKLLGAWLEKLDRKGIRMIVSGDDGAAPKGVGYGRNRAIEQSSGTYLCFCDIDDTMTTDRIASQYEVASGCPPNTLIGSKFVRDPPDSTHRYTRWCCSLSAHQLYTQIYTAFGPTLIQPTWFCSRALFDGLGPFSEAGKGEPEDLVFFHRHLSQGGRLQRVDKELVVYRYHDDCETFEVNRVAIWSVRVAALQKRVLSKWSHFTIWNAGKQGRQLYRSLLPENRAKVVAFCDVDKKKIEQKFYNYEECNDIPKPRVPIVHFSNATPPFVLCVKLDLTKGQFEENLASLNLQEGEDYCHFS